MTVRQTSGEDFATNAAQQTITTETAKNSHILWPAVSIAVKRVILLDNVPAIKRDFTGRVDRALDVAQ